MTTPSKPSMRGTLFCAISAVAYTAYNVCLRDVSDKHDPSWINCVQASVGTAVFGMCLVWQTVRGRCALPPWSELLALLVIGLITQLGGVLMIWAMGVVGVGITGTLQMGVMLAASAVLGLIVLGERIFWRQVAAIAMITAAVVFFSMGAQSPGEVAPSPTGDGMSLATGNDTAASNPLHMPNTVELARLLGIGAGVLAGLAFAVLTVGIRKTVTSATSPEAVVFLVNAMGVATLGPWCAWRVGLTPLVQTPLPDLGVMLAAGAMNLIGFLLVTKSLQLIAVVRVNVINNGLTMALTVVAGMVLFAESWNRNILLGILLSAVGTLLISLAPPAETDVAEIQPLNSPASVLE